MTTFLSDIVLAGANDIQFKSTSGANTGKIESDGNNLVLSNAVGDILLGDGASDVYIGDGTNNVDILFEQSGSIKAEDGSSGVTLTLGSGDTTLALGSSISSAATVLGALTVGVDDTGHDVKFFGATSGAYMLWDESEDGLVITHPAGDAGLEVYTVSSTPATTPQFKVGRSSTEYFGVCTEDRTTHLIHRQDETDSGAMYTSSELWGSGSGNDSWTWKHGTNTGGSLATVMTLDKAGQLTVTGEIEGGSLDINGNADISGTLDLHDQITSYAGGALFRKQNDSWSNGTTHDVLYQGWYSNTGDYVYLKAPGNSGDNHGIAFIGDDVIALGRSDVEIGNIDNNSATAPLSENWFVLNSSSATFAGNVTAGSNSLTAGSLDINGNADISGNLTGLDNVTSTNFIIGGHTINDVDITSEDSNADDHLMTSKAIVNLIADNENSFLTSVPNHSGNLITTGTVAAARVATLNQNTTGSSGSCTGNAATATDATNLNATDDRDMAPEDYGYANDFRVFFTSKEGLEDGTSTGSNWQDALYINSYTDASGGDANVLAFDKSTKAIYHYQADQAATNWGTAKQLAYTDSDVSGDTTGNAATVTNGVYTTGDQTIAGVKTFTSNIKGTPANANTHSLTLGRTDNSNYWHVNHAGNDFRLYNTASSGSHILFGVDSGGTVKANNVGIGVATPASLLHVAGTVQVGVDDTGHDVKFYGATSGKYMLWDESDDRLLLTDNTHLELGAGGDLQMLHNGSASFIQNYGGDLKIINNANDKDIIFQSDDGSGGAANYLVVDGSAEQTRFYKDTRHTDGIKANFGNADDLQIYHDGSNSYISNHSGGHLYIQQNLDDRDIVLQCDDGSGGTTAYLTLDGSAGTIEVAKTINSTAPITSTGQITGTELEGTSLDINGDADISGNITTASWRGATIAHTYLTKRQTFDFKGYSTHDGTNYEIPQAMTDTNAPFEHNTSVGSAGTTAISVSLLLRAGGQVMPYAGTIKKWTGWAAGSGSGTINLALFRYRPDTGNSSAQSLVLIDDQALTAAGAQTVAAIEQTSFTNGDIAAGDIIMTGIKGVSSKTTYFTSTMEIEWD